MLTFNVTLQREFDVQVEADSLEAADAMARDILTHFPPGKAKLTSVAKDEAIRVPAAKPKRQRTARCAADEWLEPDER